MTAPLFSLRDVGVRFGGLRALNRFSMAEVIAQNESGTSGAHFGTLALKRFEIIS